MNASLFGMLNGIAKDARAGTYTGGSPDQNAMALMEELAQRAEFVLGTTYDSSTSYTTTYYITGPTNPQYPSGSVNPSWDSLQNIGNVNVKQAGG